MNYEIVLRLVPVLLGVIGLAKIFYDLSIARRTWMRDEYRFAKDFLEAIEINKKIHPFLREKGYQAIAGSKLLNADEIQYLLSLNGSNLAIRDYSLGRTYLQHLPKSGVFEIDFKEKYKKDWSRKWRKWSCLAGYAVCAVAAFFPLIISGIFLQKITMLLRSFVLTFPIFGFYALFFLWTSTKIHRAEKLVKNQHLHAQVIILKAS